MCARSKWSYTSSAHIKLIKCGIMGTVASLFSPLPGIDNRNLYTNKWTWGSDLSFLLYASPPPIHSFLFFIPPRPQTVSSSRLVRSHCTSLLSDPTRHLCIIAVHCGLVSQPLRHTDRARFQKETVQSQRHACMYSTNRGYAALVSIPADLTVVNPVTDPLFPRSPSYFAAHVT